MRIATSSRALRSVRPKGAEHAGQKDGLYWDADKHYGVVHEKDLGQGTAGLAGTMTEHNPDASWTTVTE